MPRRQSHRPGGAVDERSPLSAETGRKQPSIDIRSECLGGPAQSWVLLSPGGSISSADPYNALMGAIMGDLMRVAFFGFSSPLAYDYKHKAERAPADTVSSPNPIVFGATSIMLLFDEVWFVTRSLCPLSMRGLRFVKFLDEEGRLTPEMMKRAVEEVSDMRGIFPHSLDEKFPEKREYKKVEEHFLTKNDFGWDNHTHRLNVLGCPIQGNSGSQYHVELDRRMRRSLAESPVELVYNPFWAEDLTAEVKSLSQIGITNEFVLKRIPNPFDKNGPKVDDVEKLRDNKYIGDYRRWISEQEFPGNIEEIREVAEKIERDIFEAKTRAYLSELDPSRFYKSLSKNAFGEFVGQLVPGGSFLLEAAKGFSEDAKIQRERWRAFLLSMEVAADR
jgi:hypothetical protein